MLPYGTIDLKSGLQPYALFAKFFFYFLFFIVNLINISVLGGLMALSDGLWFSIIKNLSPHISKNNKKDTKTHKKPALDNVSKRKRPYCPYCKGHLNFASGEWNDKHCTTCNRRVKPFYAP
jgi:hypothetical protein